MQVVGPGMVAIPTVHPAMAADIPAVNMVNPLVTPNAINRFETVDWSTVTILYLLVLCCALTNNILCS